MGKNPRGCLLQFLGTTFLFACSWWLVKARMGPRPSRSWELQQSNTFLGELFWCTFVIYIILALSHQWTHRMFMVFWDTFGILWIHDRKQRRRQHLRMLRWCGCRWETPEIFDLLKWVKETFVDFSTDSRVIHREELLFLVRQEKLDVYPWSCQLKVFNVRAQTDQLITFRLKQTDGWPFFKADKPWHGGKNNTGAEHVFRTHHNSFFIYSSDI